MYFAHSENSKGQKHKLNDHLLRTAELTSLFALSAELEQLFYFARLVHDVGKA